MIEEPKAGASVGTLGPIVRELVKTVNRLEQQLKNMKVTPDQAGKFVPSDSNITLQLNTTDQCPGS